MMDEFYEYWELIPDFEKYEKVGKVSSARLRNIFFSAPLSIQFKVLIYFVLILNVDNNSIHLL